ncbi:hypothetical protein C3B78_13330 [Arthrobacter sp. PGP41]|nr:hypothetical protein C3B78_13330 [Arthrobacter sp. PGP41]
MPRRLRRQPFRSHPRHRRTSRPSNFPEPRHLPPPSRKPPPRARLPARCPCPCRRRNPADS